MRAGYRIDLDGKMKSGRSSDGEARMKKLSTKPTEHDCPECDGTGFRAVVQPKQPGRKIYPARCQNCGGKGRITEAAN